ncbi:MAG TPA: hypothetical protein DDY68_05195 [Porphyromonadaceae bacterium]|nr:hypothetical protein [Porphyromonadaceae bacterium]
MQRVKYVENELFFSQIKKSLQEGKKVRFEVRGYSMYPLLRNEGDEVLLKPFSATEGVKRGDIALFYFQDKYILHRVIGREGEQVFFRGDNVYDYREECGEEEIIGVVEEIYRRKKSSHPPTFALVSPRSLKWRIWISMRRALARVVHRVR